MSLFTNPLESPSREFCGVPSLEWGSRLHKDVDWAERKRFSGPISKVTTSSSESKGGVVKKELALCLMAVNSSLEESLWPRSLFKSVITRDVPFLSETAVRGVLAGSCSSTLLTLIPMPRPAVERAAFLGTSSFCSLFSWLLGVSMERKDESGLYADEDFILADHRFNVPLFFGLLVGSGSGGRGALPEGTNMFLFFKSRLASDDVSVRKPIPGSCTLNSTSEVLMVEWSNSTRGMYTFFSAEEGVAKFTSKLVKFLSKGLSGKEGSFLSFLGLAE